MIKRTNILRWPDPFTLGTLLNVAIVACQPTRLWADQPKPQASETHAAAVIEAHAVVGVEHPHQPLQENGPSESATHTKDVSKPRAGPKFLDLRYDEDFSYLDGPAGSYKRDLFDPIKNIRLAPDWHLSLGGEMRIRIESETNKAFGATEPANDTFQLYRLFLHADLQYRELFRVFVQGVETFDEDRNLAPRAIDENQWDLQQIFFDLRFLGDDSPWTLRAGRQELSYGSQRLVSPLEWANTRRRFDAVKVFTQTEHWNLDFFYAKPVAVQRRQNDRYNEDFDFYGIFATYKGIADHGLDAYFFAVDDTGNPLNPNGRRGDKSTYTLGARLWGKRAGFDYEAEVAGQWGHWARDTVCAWATTLDGGYTFAHETKPRIGAGFDWATGDRQATDRKVETFDQLFPFGHNYLGYLDFVGRQNIIGPNVNFSVWAVPQKLRAAAAWRYFWLADESDALYNAGGGASRRDATGRSGKEVGNELDLTLLWKVDVHSSVLLGWSHFWDGRFIQRTGRSENADFVYVQYAFKF